MTCLDVGANVGAVTLMLAQAVGPTGRVVATEPGPPYRARLQRNLTLNSNLQARVTVEPVGVSDTMGSLTWEADPDAPFNAVLSQDGSWFRSGRGVDVPVVAKAADTLPALFEQQVARTPDAIALEFEGETLTYAQFDAAANRMARYLVSIGVGPETTVGLAIRRSLDLLVAMYGIAKAGGAYVPLDPDHPADRIAHVLAAARPVAVLTTSRDGIEVPAHVPLHEVDRLDLTGFDAAPLTDADRTSPLRPDNTAYIIFTSGSTGLPKGVAVAHRAIVANLRWRQREYGFTEADVILQKTPFTFDVSVWEFFWPLQVGARLVVAVPDVDTVECSQTSAPVSHPKSTGIGSSEFCCAEALST